MKKTTIVILSLVMMLSVVACGNPAVTENKNESLIVSTEETAQEETRLTVEQMLEQAVEVTERELYNSKPWENLVRSEDTHVGKTYKSSSFYVDKVENDHAILGLVSYSNIKFKVFLDRNELGRLNVGERIQFVGIVDSIEKESEVVVVFNMSEAYIVTNRIVISGKYETMSYNGKNYGVIGNTAITLDSDELKNLKTGDYVTIEGVVRYDSEMAWYFQMTSHVRDIMEEAKVIK